MHEYRPEKIPYGEGTAIRGENGGYSAGLHALSYEEEQQALAMAASGSNEVFMRTHLWEQIDKATRQKEEALAYKQKHGKFPNGFNLEENAKNLQSAHKALKNFDDSFGTQFSDEGWSGIVALLGINAVLWGSAYALSEWEKITSAAKTAGEFVLGAGIGAAGAAATAVITVGAYKVSNFVWEKATGHSSPLKSALTTAALFATAAGGVYISNRPAETAPARPEATSPLQADFQKALPLTIGQSYSIKTRTTSHVKPGSGIVSDNLVPGDCVLVRETQPETGMARVETGLVLGWVDAKALGPAISCTPAP